MSFPAVEIAHSVATDAYRANPTDNSIVAPALDLVGSSEGAIRYVSRDIMMMHDSDDDLDLQSLPRAASRRPETCICHQW